MKYEVTFKRTSCETVYSTEYCSIVIEANTEKEANIKAKFLVDKEDGYVNVCDWDSSVTDSDSYDTLDGPNVDSVELVALCTPPDEKDWDEFFPDYQRYLEEQSHDRPGFTIGGDYFIVPPETAEHPW